MDAAALAAQSDPERNWHFSRPWNGPPNRKRPGRHPQAFVGFISGSSIPTDSPADRAAQRAITKALARASQLDRIADLLLSMGRPLQAERMAHRAAELRAVAE